MRLKLAREAGRDVYRDIFVAMFALFCASPWCLCRLSEFPGLGIVESAKRIFYRQLMSKPK
jgi:hypothetical protein